MENILMVYVTAFGIVISVLALYAVRGDETLSRKWSRVRVRSDENPRRQVPEPEEEVDTHSPLQWLLLGGMFLLLILLANAA